MSLDIISRQVEDVLYVSSELTSLTLFDSLLFDPWKLLHW